MSALHPLRKLHNWISGDIRHGMRRTVARTYEVEGCLWYFIRMLYRAHASVKLVNFRGFRALAANEAWRANG
jgi:hypothetical protein